MKRDKQVFCFQFAFGATTGQRQMSAIGTSKMNRMLDENCVNADDPEVTAEWVEISTLDAFCDENAVELISLLRVDTEGSDLDVLNGASDLLGKHRIDFVQVEAGMHPGNTLHVEFETLKHYLEEHRYFVFGNYEQVGERATHQPHLRRTNPVFISEKLIDCSARTGLVDQSEKKPRSLVFEWY